jgi:hypothetical protein
VKWLNDALDTVDGLGVRYPHEALASNATNVHSDTVAALRKMPGAKTTGTVKLAASESKAKHPDQWDDTEGIAVEHLVHTLDIIGLGFPNPAVGADDAHATALVKGRKIDLLAIRGETHEKCIEHSKTFLPLPRRQVLLVSRDRDNTPWRKRFGSYLTPDTPQLGQEAKITEPQNASLHLGYERLLHIFRTSPTSAAVNGAINAELAS